VQRLVNSLVSGNCARLQRYNDRVGVKPTLVRRFGLVGFLLGSVEAGFYPGVIVYLARWVAGNSEDEISRGGVFTSTNAEEVIPQRDHERADPAARTEAFHEKDIR